MASPTRVFEEVACAVCGSTDADPIAERGQFGFTTNICLCRACGLGYLNPRWNDATYLQFYTNEYDSYYRPKPMTRPPEESGFSYYPIIKRLEAFPDFKFERVLDVGSGDGSQIRVFQKYFPDAYYAAIEPSGTHQAALEKQGVAFLSNDVNSNWTEQVTQPFDLIIMRHVLEHFLDPVEVLRRLRDVLSPDGLLYIAVPDSLNLALPLTDSFYRVVHTYYFNRHTLRNVLHKAGFELSKTIEGDHYNSKELIAFGQVAAEPLPLNIDKSLYEQQRAVFVDEMERERSIAYKVDQAKQKLWGRIVKVKKYFFPKPIGKS